MKIAQHFCNLIDFVSFTFDFGNADGGHSNLLNKGLDVQYNLVGCDCK